MKRILLFILCFALWLLLTLSISWQYLAAGVGISFLATLFFGGIAIEKPFKLLQPWRWFWMLCYMPLLIWECLKANFDVAYRVLHPGMPIKPGIVKVKTTLRSDMAKTMLANSITLTPGTMTVDLKDDYLYIHWINIKDSGVEEATKMIVKRFEGLLAKVFD